MRYLIAVTGLVILNEIQINFSACVTLTFDRWPQETTGNLFHAPKSYECHFITIHEFKLEPSSRQCPAFSIWAKMLSYRLTVTACTRNWYFHFHAYNFPDSKVHGANMGPTWVLSAPDGPHVGPMNLAIRVPLMHIRPCQWHNSRD